MDYKNYISECVFVSYEKNDLGHQMPHINSVIEKSLKLSLNYPEVDVKLIYIAAAYHDIAHYIDKDRHEELSAEMFYNDKFMCDFLSNDERIIVKEAIEDHRSSSSSIPRSIYGKILYTADKSLDVITFIKRTHGYSLKHFSDYSFEDKIRRAFNHMREKYCEGGTNKVYIYDEDYEKVVEEMTKLSQNYDEFKKLYLKVISPNETVICHSK